MEENQVEHSNGTGQTALPQATGVLILGIVSIVLCWCLGIVGLICGLIALSMAKKGMDLYNSNPGMYSESSFKNLKAGRICAIIGTILSGLYLVYTIIMIAVYGVSLTQMPWDQM